MPKLDVSEKLSSLGQRLEACEQRKIPDHSLALNDLSIQLSEIKVREGNYIVNSQLQNELTRLFTQMKEQLTSHTLKQDKILEATRDEVERTSASLSYHKSAEFKQLAAKTLDLEKGYRTMR